VDRTETDRNEAIVKEIVIEAPAERIFEALADPRQRVRWWGVAGKFQVTHMESELRPGGAWVMRGTGMGGKPFTLRGVYCAIERPHVLEFTWQPDWEEPESLVRFDLDEREGSTTVRVTHSGLSSQASRERYQGWPWLLALLRGYVRDSEAKVD
jgi:uncharacterized protein YndB with AHSA1/START domain